jgi:hypothetical protein
VRRNLRGLGHKGQGGTRLPHCFIIDSPVVAIQQPVRDSGGATPIVDPSMDADGFNPDLSISQPAHYH